MEPHDIVTREQDEAFKEPAATDFPPQPGYQLIIRTPDGYGIDVTFGTERALRTLLVALGQHVATGGTIAEIIDGVVERLGR